MSCVSFNWLKRLELAWRLLPGSFAAVSVALLMKAGLFQPLEQIGYQSVFQLRGKQVWDDRLVLVAIDDASLSRIGRFPWSRQQYVKLLNLLKQADTNIVVFDLLFSEPSPDDPDFAAAIDHHERVILAQAWNADGSPLLPVPVLRHKALGVGHILTQQNTDGIVRQVLPQIGSASSLGFVATQAYSFIRARVSLPQTDAPLQLNWVGDAESLPHYSFADVVQGKVPLQVFNRKIVLVGVTATGIDPLITPFDRNPPTSSVMLHATLIQNLLQQTCLRSLGISWVVVLLIVGGPLLGWHLSGRGWLRQVAAIAGLWAGWLLLSVGLLQSNILLPIVAPLVLFLLSGSLTGICDRLREAATLRRQLHQIQQQEALQEEFFRTASHELRTPVANIQSAISLLRVATSPEDWQEYLQILEEECQQESALINDLLDFQRVTSTHRSPELETRDLRDWLTEVAVPFSFRARTAQQQLSIQVESEYPEMTLDWSSLRRIVTELLNNACKYTPPQGTIRVKAQVVNRQLYLSVSNSGVTIPSDQLEKIFEPFYRVVELDCRSQGGTGLGLAIIKRLAQHQGGGIQVMNQNGILTFTVRLPIQIEPLSVSEPQIKPC
jgi:signal transduction histidine kinase